MPDFVEGRRCLAVFADQAAEADADDVAAGFLGHVDHLGVELGNIGCLLGTLALIDGQLDLGEHFRCGEFADVVQIAGIVGGLQADEVDLGVAHEAVGVKTGRQGCYRGSGCSGGNAATGRLEVLGRRDIAAIARAGTGVLHAGIALGGGFLAQEEADNGEDDHGEQGHHHEVGEFFTETEVRSQGGEAETGGETGQRAHPGTLGLGGLRGSLGRLTGSLLGRGGFMRLARGDRLALHAGRATAAEALGGFGIADAEGQAEHEGGGHEDEILHMHCLRIRTVTGVVYTEAGLIKPDKSADIIRF